jgi:hypothetical protein
MLVFASKNRHALKYPASLGHKLARDLHQSFCSKYTAITSISKPTVTKKRYSELPALHAQCSHPADAVLGSSAVSDARLACQASLSECALLFQIDLYTSINLVISFFLISRRSLN